MSEDDIKKLIAEARDYETLDRMTPGELFGLAGKLADALEAEHQRAETEHYQKNRARNERDALRAVIQSVLDAWSIPGVRPDYHEYMKNNLHRNWPVLYEALRALTGVD